MNKAGRSWLHLTQRAIISLAGPDRVAFLQNIVTADLKRLTPEHSLWSALLTPQGQFRFDFFLIDLGDSIWIDCEAAQLAELGRVLAGYRVNSRIQLRPATTVQVLVGLGPLEDLFGRANELPGLPGPATGFGRGVTLDLGEFGDPGVLVVDPRSELLGFRLYRQETKPTAKIPATLDALPCTLGGQAVFSDHIAHAYEHLRVTLGLGDGQRDYEALRGNPLDYDFDRFGTLSLDKGCFIGQEVVARMAYRGKRPRSLATFGAFPVAAASTEAPKGENAIYFEDLQGNQQPAGFVGSVVEHLGDGKDVLAPTLANDLGVLPKFLVLGRVKRKLLEASMIGKGTLRCEAWIFQPIEPNEFIKPVVSGTVTVASRL